MNAENMYLVHSRPQFGLWIHFSYKPVRILLWPSSLLGAGGQSSLGGYAIVTDQRLDSWRRVFTCTSEKLAMCFLSLFEFVCRTMYLDSFICLYRLCMCVGVCVVSTLLLQFILWLFQLLQCCPLLLFYCFKTPFEEMFVMLQ